jgi:ubiquinone/menaquinone biosynthesis C-methylase UbiE
VLSSVLTATTLPYRASEAWIYDTVIAPAVAELRAGVQDSFVAELPPGARVLEVGSGGGQLAVDLATRRRDVTIVGVDLSPAQVARAARRAEKAGVADRVTFTDGNALELPVDDAAFDAVVSIGSIKHWPDPAQGLRECVRALRPGGRLVVVEVDRSCLLDDARAFVARWRMPAAMRPLALVLFRTFVAGQGLDLDDGRRLLAALPLRDTAVSRVPATPGVLFRGLRM